jgi:hypothetical protein
MMVGFLGGTLAVLTFIGFLQTGQKKILLAVMGIVIVTAILISISVVVKTDKEIVTDFMHSSAQALKNNDFETIYSRIHPNATQTVAQAKNELPSFKFSDARVTKIESIELTPKHIPPKAVVEMLIVVEGTFRGYSGKIPRRVRMTLYKKDDRWLIFDYAHAAPLEAF